MRIDDRFGTRVASFVNPTPRSGVPNYERPADDVIANAADDLGGRWRPEVLPWSQAEVPGRRSEAGWPEAVIGSEAGWPQTIGSEAAWAEAVIGSEAK